MNCRIGCGACCIAPSITESIPGMPNGKPAGVRCVQLDKNNHCLLFLSSTRPLVCEQFMADLDFCGNHQEQALELITMMEAMTKASS